MTDGYEPIVDEAPVFPFYLDVEMLTGFLATLEGGFSLSSSVSETEATSGVKDLSTSAGGGVGGLFSSIFKMDMQGTLKLNDTIEEGRAFNFVLQHTEASLFNRLRNQLYSRGLVTVVNDDSTELPPLGAMVEIDGVLQQNPLTTVLELLQLVSPLVPGLAPPKDLSAKGRNLSKPATKLPRGQRDAVETRPQNAQEMDVSSILEMLRKEEDNRKLSDVLVTIGEGAIRSGIVTLRQAAVTQESTEHFLGSRCLILGKVSGVIEEGENVPLHRRSLLRLMSQSDVRQLFTAFTSNPGFTRELPSVEVSGPAIQVLPVAIYV